MRFMGLALCKALACAGLWSGGASAQTFTYAPFSDSAAAFRLANGLPAQVSGVANPATDYVFVQRFSRLDAGDASAQSGFGFLSVGALASSAGLATDQAMSAALVQIARRIDRVETRLSEGIALAGSFNIMQPNPGDRFAVSVGGAGYGGAAAASVSVSARIGDDGLAYLGVAKGPTQSLVKGGLGWSFR